MAEKDRNTLELILGAAKKEFLEKGFKGSTLRGIASRAGLTTGALYRYYSSKEDLFGALVSSTYYGLIDMYEEILTEFRKMPAEMQQTGMVDYTMKGMEGMMDFIFDHRDAMKLILCSSEGTEYNGLVHEMARLDTDATHDFATDSHEAGFDNVTLVDPRLEHMLTTGMFNTFFELIIHDVGRKEADGLMKSLILFYSAGWQRLMGF